METGYEKQMTARIDPTEANIMISFPPEVERSFRPYALKAELIRLATNFAGVSIGIYGFNPEGYSSGMESGTFYDSQIKFLGYSLKDLRAITGDVERTLRRNPRIRQVRIVRRGLLVGGSLDTLEIVLRPDREALRRYDVDPDHLRFHVQSCLPDDSTSRLGPSSEAGRAISY